jgi:AcrR family transcriptional regulator
MTVVTSPDSVRTSRGGRPRDPSRDGVIREAILHLLGEVGYGALTMDAVAAEAGVGKATIYRRWRTKQDLVVDTVAVMSQALAASVDTGSLEGDVRVIVHRLVDMITGPIGTAIRSLLPAMLHQPALHQAFRDGPMEVWSETYAAMWASAEARGEAPAGMHWSIPAEAISALLIQRWLFTGDPVTHEYADETLDKLILPMLRDLRP